VCGLQVGPTWYRGWYRATPRTAASGGSLPPLLLGVIRRGLGPTVLLQFDQKLIRDEPLRKAAKNRVGLADRIFEPVEETALLAELLEDRASPILCELVEMADV
jgi:hypothetical protein